MNHIIAAMTAIGLILTVGLQMEAIAKSTSAQALEFAQDMDNAMPCATSGRPLEECSTFHDFSQDTKDYQSELESMKLQIMELQKQLNATK